jgi:hypothetical protein
LSVLSNILNAVQADVEALGLLYNQVPVPVRLLKLQKVVSPQVDSLPCIIVSPSEKGETFKFFGEGQVSKEYTIQIAILLAANGDAVTNLTTLTEWRAAIAGLFQYFNGPNLGQVSGLYNVRPDFQPFLDRAAWAKLYDISSLQIVVKAIEGRPSEYFYPAQSGLLFSGFASTLHS